jgi:hypothetical protein
MQNLTKCISHLPQKFHSPCFTIPILIPGPSTAPPSQLLMGNKFVDDHYITEGTVTQIPMESGVEVCTQTIPGNEPMDMAIQTEQVFQEKATLALAAELSLENQKIPIEINNSNSSITLPPGMNNTLPYAGNIRKRSYSVDVGSVRPLAASSNPSVVVRRRSSIDVNSSMRLPAFIEPVSVEFLRSSLDNALGDSVERSFLESHDSLGDSLIEPDQTSLLTSSLPSQLEDSKPKINYIQGKFFCIFKYCGLNHTSYELHKWLVIGRQKIVLSIYY